MTQLPTIFDPNAVAPSTGGGNQLPISDKNGHLVIITDSSMEMTKNNDGSYLRLELQITEGPCAGQSGDMKLNIGNKSSDAVRIALSELSAICHVVGWVQPLQDVSVLYNKPFRVVVGMQKGEEAMEKGYTEIKAIRDRNGNKPGQSGNAAPTASGPAPAPAAPVAPPQQQPQGFPQPQQQVAPPQQQFAQPQQQFAAPQGMPQQFAAPQQQFAPQPQQQAPAPQQQQPFAAPQPQNGVAAPWQR